MGPHPHLGLQTVTWLLDGQALQKDTLGSEQVIAPGQLSLMTAGHAVAHAEEATGHYRGTLEGIQLWIAQPARTRSPARHDTPLVGVVLDLRAPTTVPLRRDFEYALVVMRGSLAADGTPATTGQLAYLGRGRDEVRLDVAEPARAILLGGEPFPEPLLMWWNFVARTRAEIDGARVSVTVRRHGCRRGPSPGTWQHPPARRRRPCSRRAATASPRC